MKIRCCMCKKDMGEDDSGQEGVTDSYCPSCSEEVKQEIKEARKEVGRHYDTYEM